MKRSYHKNKFNDFDFPSKTFMPSFGSEGVRSKKNNSIYFFH